MHADRLTRPKIPWLVIIVCASVLLACCVAWTQGPERPQTSAAQTAAYGPPFRAVNYEVFASLAPEMQTLSARATIEFEARQPSATVECELNPNLRITSVRDEAGEELGFDRSGNMQIRVTLPQPLTPGQRTKLTFEYSGSLASEEYGAGSGVRLAYIGNDGVYLLQPARWFPLTAYPANRYTGIFHIEVPQNFVVAGTGTPSAPVPPEAVSIAPSPTPQPAPAAESTAASPKLTRSRAHGGSGSTRTSSTQSTQTNSASAPASSSPASSAPAPAAAVFPEAPGSAPGSRLVYTFRVDRPEPAGTFVAGSLKLVPVQAEGVNVSVYVRPGAEATAQAYGDEAARIEIAYSNQFGPLPHPDIAVAQMLDNTIPAFSAPGITLISQRQWTTPVNTRLLANLVAGQWWGSEVTAASPSDVWLTDGLARYCEALYVEQTAGVGGLNKALDDFAVGALMDEGAAPIAEAGRLAPFSANYNSVVVNKGAMVFHMLREQLGDSAFSSLLGDFYKQFGGKAAAIADFEKMAQDRASKLAAGPGGASSDSGAAPNFVLGNSQAPQGSLETSRTVNLGPFFAQWVDSTGVPEFSLDYTVYRTMKGFRVDGKVKQNLDFFHMPVELEIQTEGNPEYKTIPVSGTESSFDIEVFGRPKQNGITLDPHNYILKSSPQLQVRAIIARGEAFAEQGRYYDAIQQYSQALQQQKNDSLALFRTGEAFFYQKNYSAAANTFRDALDGDLDSSSKWVEVWSHIYLGKIYDIAGDRTRAVNEYSKAQATNDDTGGAQAEAQKYLTQPYKDNSPAAAPATPASTVNGPTPAAPANAKVDSDSDVPVLKRREDQ